MTGHALVASVAGALLFPLAHASGQETAWIRQVGSAFEEEGRGVAADPSGAVYLVGSTRGDLGGSNAGQTDAFLAKYDVTGDLLWIEQFGTPEFDEAAGVGVAPDGSVVVVGRTSGSFGGPNAGSWDVFVAKFAPSGTLLWRIQFGSSEADNAADVAFDLAGNVHVVGSTWGSRWWANAGGSDVLVAKVGPDGSVLWARQFGGPDPDLGTGIAPAPQGTMYVSVHTVTFPLPSGSLSRLGGGGQVIWTAPIPGTGADDVAADALGNAYVVGTVYGGSAPTGSGYDAFVAGYNALGLLIWYHVMGSPADDGAFGVAVDVEGRIVVGGDTRGSLGGPHAGSDDVFVALYEPGGPRLWVRQFGADSRDYGTSLSLGSRGGIYVAGATSSDFGGPLLGPTDAFVARIGSPCRPDLTGTAIPTGAGYGVPDSVLNNDDFFYYLDQFSAGNLAVADLTSTATPGAPGYGTPNGIITFEDFIYYLASFSEGC